MELLRKVEQTISRERLLDRGDGIVVAVSGGPDSVALLHLLLALAPAWDWRLVVAHVNHRFRPGEAEEEAEFVERLAERLGLPCEIGVIDVPAYIRETGDNPQNAAREKRYAFLASVAAAYGMRRVALAHHADDQAETVLMKLIRGAGPAGLGGMLFCQSFEKLELIRPLLRITKRDLVSYCEHHGFDYVTDSSNAERKYTRNRVRLDVMPLLREYNAEITESLSRLALIMQEENRFLEEETEAVFRRLAAVEPGSIAISGSDFAGLGVALQRRLIKLILNYLSSQADATDFARVELVREAILQRARSNLSLDLSGTVRMVKEYDRIRFTGRSSDPGSFYYEWNGEQGDLVLSESGSIVEYFITEDRHAAGAECSCSSEEAVFDFDRLALPLAFRSRRPGDRMQVIGLKGSKKVKDIFIDDKIPPTERDRLPLLTDADGQILWIPGVRRSAAAPVTDSTTRFLRLTLRKPEGTE
ncbi:tRNA(Ile)-lysidine synthase [Paenibacillus sp. J31TS4]|uniref:tRNA lysidine(34) synthetase TilS n=1 Tax=Paenibacillus sp. J31TS4 TaxID=2807195 RepID=UPI001B059D73|nr:tRNA lysidine(34) synthetase TilS [Paenibacillus sp. J31TS4]GIP41337.1 tRNA(Ile)-lysidine synthase [Paenibacillus sp. J31TS4]